MRTYGEPMHQYRFVTRQMTGCSHSKMQSKRHARNKSHDKALLHRRARRLYEIDPAEVLEGLQAQRERQRQKQARQEQALRRAAASARAEYLVPITICPRYVVGRGLTGVQHATIHG